jgi:RNA polymerase sigma factor (TIGR02999 family)
VEIGKADYDLAESAAGGPNPELPDLLRRAEQSGAASEELFALLYAELHRLAQSHLRRQGGRLTLGATTLVHEVYLNMVGRNEALFPDRARFFAYASRAMRGLAIDYSRRRQAIKRGRQFEITLDENEQLDPGVAAAATNLSELGDALVELAEIDPLLVELVDLHFFGGLSFGDIASLRGVSERTVQRDWQKARLLLHRALHDEPSSPGAKPDPSA